MADQLVAEEVDRDAVGVPPGQLAAERADVERLCLIEVVDRDRQMEDVAALPHDTAPSKHSSVSARRPSRIVSSPRTAVRRDVAEVDVGTDPPHEVALELGRGRLEEQLLGCDVAGQDLLDEAEAELAVGPADAGAAALAGLQRHQERAGLEVLVDALDPAVRRQTLRALRVLEADLGHHVELGRQLP